MKALKNHARSLCRLGLLSALMVLARTATAENFFIYGASEGEPPSSTWPAIWTNALGGAATAPVSGGIYTAVYNGVQIGVSGSPTSVRAPYVSSTPSPTVFPGDSLVLNFNTRWILKQDTVASGQVQTNLAGTTGVAALTIANPVFNFPGNNGYPGLTLNGGCLNPGDAGYAYVITGTVQAAPGTQSYVFAGGTPLGTPALRAVSLIGQLSGSGGLVLASSTNIVPGLQVLGPTNTFTGAWVVQAGWLQGIGHALQDGYNSLGTNGTCSITVDPNYVLPTGSTSNTFSASGEIALTNNTLLDLGSSLMNSAGTLILTNNGKMWLHGHYVFSAANINGTPLANGYYSYNTLTNSFPGNFTGLPSVFTTFGGDITVQPPGAPPAFAPFINTEPLNVTNFSGDMAVFSTAVSGLQPLACQWFTVDSTGTIFARLANGSGISGANTNTLTIASATALNVTNYVLVITNTLGAATSSIVSLVIVPAPASVTLNYATAGNSAVLMGSGADWNSAGYWWDGSADGGLSAATLATDLPGVPFVVPPGSLLRTTSGALSATFPGAELDLDGDGNFVNDTGNVNDSTALLACKQGGGANFTGSLYFTNLVINGGRIDDGVASIPVFNGGMTIGPNNAYFYIDPTAGDRGFQINSTISGAGTIQEYLYSGSGSFQAGYTNDLDIAGTNNPFTGTWDITQGVLLGSGPGSLGTNSILVDYNGALETMYNLDDSNATLTINGEMLLHQNDTFANVTVVGVSLPPGTYTWAQLNSYSPANFPASWSEKFGSSSNTASGSITVLAGNGGPLYFGAQPQSQSVFAGNTATFTAFAGGLQPLYYQWQEGIAGSGGPYTNVINSGRISGATTNSLTIQNVNLNDDLDYVLVISNSFGTMMSSPATLTVNPIPPNISLGYGQSGYGGVIMPIGADWNSIGYWWDGTYDGGLSASTLAVELPGVPFVALPASLLRTPAGALTSTFPESELDLDGDGNFVSGTSAGTTSILACKNGLGTANSGELYFTNLVIDGGQVDNGAGGVTVFDGGITIGVTNAFFYVDNTGTGDRGFQINSTLSGTGMIELELYSAQSAFETSYTNNLDITGANNSFTGQWLVTQGPLLGSGNGSLGTNSIDVEANGALETLYSLNDPTASLTLNGMLYLHQHDTFQSVTVNGNVLPDGTYTAAQLNALYPANFPLSWTMLNGSSYSSASGSLTVGSNQTLAAQFSAGNLTLSWSNGSLLQATNLAGPWVTNTLASPPSYTVPTTNAQMFFMLSP